MSAISVETIRRKLGKRSLNPIRTDDTKDELKANRHERGIDIAYDLCAAFVRKKMVGTLEAEDKTFVSFVESYWNFYDPRGYIALHNKENAKKKTIGEAYANNQLGSFRKHAKKLIDQKLKTSEVTFDLLESIRKNLLLDENISNRTAITVMQSITLPVKEAMRLGLIIDDPLAKLKRIERDTDDRGIPEIDEMKKILEILKSQINDSATAETVYSAILLDVLTGLRGGEIRALTVDSIEREPKYNFSILHIEHSWPDGGKIGKTKNKVSRIVPITDDLADKLLYLAEKNPLKNQVNQRFLFWSPTDPNLAVNVSTMRDHFYTAYSCLDVERIENIDYENPDEKEAAIKKSKADRDAERAEKNIVFHSIRHFYASMLDGTRIPGSALSAYLGHERKTIHDVYAQHLLREKMAKDLDIINETISPIIPRDDGGKTNE